MSRFKPVAFVLLSLALALGAVPAAAQMALPSNVAATCTVSSSEFASWFKSGSPSLGGAVNGADSVGFPTDNTVCDFYQWGAQMFLWLTSPAEDGLILDSEGIFNVLPADSQGVRFLQPNDGTPYFALRAEKFDDIGEVGQAGSGGVLMSQGKSLVFYGVHVNDTYAYFLIGQKTGGINATVFPRNQTDLTTVESYAKSNLGAVPVAPQTLVMEMKTAWVDASTLSNPNDFVLMEAQVPTYTANADNTQWTLSGAETTTLALVGVHIVGTVQNHPEFVWITFEHIQNAPDAAYYYTNSQNQVAQQPYDSSGTFTFMATNGSESGANTECMKASGANIVAVMSGSSPTCTGGIVPSNTARTYPWGSTANSTDSAVVSNNTLLLSINQSVRGQLTSGDVRGNYLQTGGIWTSAPSATADAPIPNTSSFSSGDLRGSLEAFNATMETYVQGTSCFSCHAQSSTAPNSFQPFQLSHIYSQIAPVIIDPVVPVTPDSAKAKKSKKN